MFTLKGFVEIPKWVVNDLNIVSQFGELTPRSRTYAKDKGLHSDPLYSEVNVVAFTSALDDAPADAPAWVLKTTLGLSNWLVQRSESDSIPSDPEDLFRDIMVSFEGSLRDLKIGDIATDINDRKLPTRLSFEVINPDEIDGPSSANEVRLWFEEESFKEQYDDYVIEVLPPLLNVDDMFLSPDELRELLALNDTNTLHERIAARGGEYPQTSLRTDTYNRIYPNDSTVEIPTEWTVMLYGLAGLNLDTIKAKTVEYVLANSEHSYEEWAEILPDLFKSTEYIVIPNWHDIAIPQKTLESGMFSPTINVSKIRERMELNVPQGYGYEAEWLDGDVVCTSQSPWRSISYIAIGGPENRDNLYLLNEQIPDYIAVPTSSLEFNRMDPTTQAWALMMNRLLQIAETVDYYSDIPVGYVRIVRDNKIYVAATHERVLYLVMSQLSYTSVVVPT